MCVLGHHAASVTDTEGNQTSYVWEEQTDRLAYIGDPEGNIRSFSYDTAGRLVNTSQHADVNGVEQEVQNSYTYGRQSGDSSSAAATDQLTRITHNGFDYRFEYDGFGNLKKASVAEGTAAQTLASYTYKETGSQKNGHLEKITYGDGSEIIYVYDDLERVIRTEYKANAGASPETLTELTYDGQGNLYCISAQDGRQYYMEYDLLDRPAYMRDSDGCTYEYTYDALSRIRRLEHWNGSRRGLMQYAYDGDGREYTVSVGGLQRTASYDSCGRLASKIWSGGTDLTKVSQSFHYMSHESGTRLGTRPSAMVTGGGTFYYTYDGNGNITEIKHNNVLGTGTVIDKYHYDAASQLVSEDSQTQDATFQYIYDAGGNLKSIRKYAYTTAAVISGTPQETLSATYSAGVWKDQLMSWGNKTITYDANGSMLTKGGTTYSWGANRRLVSVSNGNAITYAYDHNGLRTRKYVNETLTEYRWAGSLLLSEKTGTDTICYFYDSTGMLVGMTLNNTLYLYIRNLQGDVIGITDRNGNVVVQYSYDSWGNTISTTGSMAATLGAKNPFRYRGYYYDAETGMYYLQSRYYDPETRRFISPDSRVYTDLNGNNLYLYCTNNPINREDPSGNSWIGTLIKELGNAFSNTKGIFVAAGAISQLDSPLPGPADIAAFSIGIGGLLYNLGISLYRSTKKTKEKAIASVHSNSKERKWKRQAIFPVNPYDFHPKNLILKEYVQIGKKKNGGIFKWEIPMTSIAIFEWDEGIKDAIGPHYHVMTYESNNRHEFGHQLPLSSVPEPWNSIYFN